MARSPCPGTGASCTTIRFGVGANGDGVSYEPGAHAGLYEKEGVTMPTAREEAAPSFAVWKRRLEQADHAHLQE
jgi:hypothetical protein